MGARKAKVSVITFAQISLLFAALSGAGILFGCGSVSSLAPNVRGEPAVPRTLVIVVPHVVERALDPINERFLADHPDVELECRAAMVDEICSRLEAEGGSGDVVVMMDGPEMRILERAGIVDASRKRTWGTCPVVMVAPEGNPKKIRSLHDVTRTDIANIAIPDPERDSTGAAFKAAAVAAGLWDDIQGKLTIAESPHAACTACEEGGADTAVTYSPCVLFGHSESTLCLAAFLPDDLYEPVKMAAAPFAGADNPLIDAYLDHLLALQSQIIVGRVGFAPVKGPSPAAADRSLLVPCGAGLQPPMDEIGEIYFNRTGIRVDFSYAGAGMLLATLNSTRRGDLYIPGESFYVDLARERGFIADQKPVVFFLPVIIVQEGNPRHIHSLRDLARPGLRVAIGDPEALAVGPVTQRVLQRAGIRDAVQRNVTMQAGCIPELANAVSMRAVDAGIVWDAVAAQHAKHVDIVPIDPRYNEVAEVLVGKLTCSKQPQEAQRLMDFIASEEAAAVFHKHGFSTESPPGVRHAPKKPAPKA
jgi:molybdate transport system substrate-binding protein